MAQTSQHLLSQLKITQYDFDPDSADPVDVTWVAAKDVMHFLVIFFRTTGTSALDTFSIIGNTLADGSGTDTTIVAHAVANEPNAQGDYVVLECNAEQIAQEAADAGVAILGISASIEFNTNSDEGIVTYIIDTKRKHLDNTVESIA